MDRNGPTAVRAAAEAIVLSVAVIAPLAMVRAALPAAGFSAAQAAEGAKVASARCAVCHGESFGGGDHGPALKGPGFWANWQGKPARGLYSRIISTMPLDDAGSLSEAETLALTAYIARLNGAGDGADVVLPDALNDLSLPAGNKQP